MKNRGGLVYREQLAVMKALYDGGMPLEEVAERFALSIKHATFRLGIGGLQPSEIQPHHLRRFKAMCAPATPEGCVLWTGAPNQAGYGRFTVAGRCVLAHRVAWVAAHGEPIPAGMVVCHACDTPACVAADHLWVGTPEENRLDASRKGRLRPPPGRAKSPAVTQRKRARLKRGAEARVLVLGRSASRPEADEMEANPWDERWA